MAYNQDEYGPRALRQAKGSCACCRFGAHQGPNIPEMLEQEKRDAMPSLHNQLREARKHNSTDSQYLKGFSIAAIAATAILGAAAIYDHYHSKAPEHPKAEHDISQRVESQTFK